MPTRAHDQQPHDDDRPIPFTPVVQPPAVVQPSLLDDEAGHPVPYSLTARARRVVAPESLPSLVVVAADDDLDDPRRPRARALRRAGTRPEAIAAELGVELTLVARWTDDVAPAPKAVRRQSAAEHRRDRELPVAYVTGRAAARSAWRRGAPAMGAAMVAGMAEVTPFAVRLHGEPGTVAGVLQWLRDTQVVAESAIRVQVLAAPGCSMDVVAHDMARRLNVPTVQVQARAWDQAPDADAVEVQVRIGDPRLAGTIDGWREELLASLVEGLPTAPTESEVAAAG